MTYKTLYSAIDFESLMGLDDWLHDEWFDLEEIIFDKERQTLEIRFERPFFEDAEPSSGTFIKTSKVPIFACHLQIRSVVDWRVNDTQKIGRYNFHSIHGNFDNSEIVIETGIPLDLRVIVTRADVSLLRNEYPIRIEPHRSF